MATLKQIRERKFITQRELAQLSGLTYATINRLEKGKHKPTFTTIKKLAAALNTDPSNIEF